LIGAQPKLDGFLPAAMAGQPVYALWPDDMQTHVERQINTKVPTTLNEPTSDEFIRDMDGMQESRVGGGHQKGLQVRGI